MVSLASWVKKSTTVRASLPKVAAAGVTRALGFAPALAARTAEWLWSHPARVPRPEREARLLATGERFSVPFGMGSLAAWRFGEGPPVLLLHGWEGRGSQLGPLVPAVVARGFSVVLFDAPGHGESSFRRSSIFRFAEALGAVARHVGPPHAIVGHSMGGAATVYALQSGLAAARVVLLAPADASLALDRFAAQIRLPEAAADQLAQGLVTRYGQPIEALAAADGAARMTAEALVIHDADDLWVPVRDGREYARHWPGARYLETQTLGHHRILRDASVVEATADFVATGRAPEALPVPARRRRAGIPFEPLTDEEVLADLTFGR